LIIDENSFTIDNWVIVKLLLGIGDSRIDKFLDLIMMF